LDDRSSHAQTLIAALRAWRAARKSQLWIKISEAVEPLGVGETTIRGLIRSGQILHRRSGGGVLLYLDSVINLAIAEIEKTYGDDRPTDARSAVLARGRETQAQRRAQAPRTAIPPPGKGKQGKPAISLQRDPEGSARRPRTRPDSGLDQSRVTIKCCH
jgi:hypothetical protein